MTSPPFSLSPIINFLNFLLKFSFHLDLVISLVGVLLAIAFFTLMERKIMGLMHYRKGPNKVILWGISQPFSDAVKLLVKNNHKLSFTKMMMFTLGPCLMIMIMLICWALFESSYNNFSNNMKILAILAIMSLSAYGFLLTSWGSNSKYSLLGGHRAVAQIISYEVCLFLFLLSIMYLTKSYSVEGILQNQKNLWFMLGLLPLFLSWVVLCMAESNRTPFDLAEGESEIVSGFNIEYGGGLFALIFISEYGMMMILSFLTALFFMGGENITMKTLLVCWMYVWIRCSFPRVRYDKLMMLSWKTLLPLSLCFLFLSVFM